MYQYRLAYSVDYPWLDRAAVASALEFSADAQAAGIPLPDLVQRFRQRIATTLLSGQGAAMLAQAGPEPVGYVLVGTGVDSSTSERAGYVLDWWVAPEHRGRGVGTALLRNSESWLARDGVRKAKLVINPNQPAGFQAASRVGFQVEGVLSLKNL